MVIIHYDFQEKQYLVDPDTLKLKEVVAAIRAWPSLLELVEFAKKRHGYGNSDGGFSILYPGDLDEYDQEVEGIIIQSCQVQFYGFWGSTVGYEYNLPEAAYLQVLIGVLKFHDLENEAESLYLETIT